MERRRYDELDPGDRELLSAARQAAETAYAPYSGFRVGAALRGSDGRMFTASNVENAAYGSTLCAERMAVGRANAEGQRAFSAVAIAASGELVERHAPVAPCGSCRQVLFEMAQVTGSDTRVLMGTPATDEVTVATLEELLPLGFAPPPHP